MSYENVPKNLTEKAVLVRAGRPDYSKLDADPFPSPAVDEAGAILEVSDTGDRYSWTGTVWIRTHEQGRLEVVNTDFLTSVALGNVPGYTLTSLQARGAISSSGYTDVWGGTSDMVYPAAAESWEIVSSSVNDVNTTGTGGWVAVVTALDSSKARVTQIVNLNGTTAVALTGTFLRPESVVIISAGSTGYNEGDITLRVAGAGAVRNVVKATLGASFDGHFTVPANTRCLVLQVFALADKGEDCSAILQIRDGTNPNPGWISSGITPIYQNQVTYEVLAKFPLAAETDIRLRGKMDTGNGTVTIILELLLIED